MSYREIMVYVTQPMPHFEYYSVPQCDDETFRKFTPDNVLSMASASICKNELSIGFYMNQRRAKR